MENYTRIDAGTGRERLLSDLDWPDNWHRTPQAELFTVEQLRQPPPAFDLVAAVRANLDRLLTRIETGALTPRQVRCFHQIFRNCARPEACLPAGEGAARLAECEAAIAIHYPGERTHG